MGITHHPIISKWFGQDFLQGDPRRESREQDRKQEATRQGCGFRLSLCLRLFPYKLQLRGSPTLRQGGWAATLSCPLVIGRKSQALASLSAYGERVTEKIKGISRDLGRAQILSAAVTFPLGQRLGRFCDEFTLPENELNQEQKENAIQVYNKWRIGQDHKTLNIN